MTDNPINRITIDPAIANRLSAGMRQGNAIELPFPVVYLWTLNGLAALKANGGAQYYGGWACKGEDADAQAAASGLNVPQSWKLTDIDSRDGKSFVAYTTRSVIVAPFGRRQSWLTEGHRVPDYVDGARRHVQVLAYLAESHGENGSRRITPWGPVVLTAKGYQARNLTDALSTWDKGTSGARSRVAPGIPAWCFYLSVGTFGKDRTAINVGKPGAQSPITPISAYMPEKIDDALISSLFVGEAIVNRMAQLQEQAAEWLAAWAVPQSENGAPLNAGASGPGMPDDPPDDYLLSEDIPF